MHRTWAELFLIVLLTQCQQLELDWPINFMGANQQTSCHFWSCLFWNNKQINCCAVVYQTHTFFWEWEICVLKWTQAPPGKPVVSLTVHFKPTIIKPFLTITFIFYSSYFIAIPRFEAWKLRPVGRILLAINVHVFLCSCLSYILHLPFRPLYFTCL